MTDSEIGQSTDDMDRIEVFGRPAVIEQRHPTVSVVRWQDNGTQGFVPTAELGGGR
jgi:hypothetical protein